MNNARVIGHGNCRVLHYCVNTSVTRVYFSFIPNHAVWDSAFGSVWVFQGSKVGKMRAAGIRDVWCILSALGLSVGAH